jgi:hypothetical protein
MVPSETTNAALAACIGVTERRVAAVKAEGRLPLTTGGRIDLAELVRRGWAATLAAKRQPVAFPEATAEQRAALRGLAPALDFTDPHDRGFAAAALLALHEAPICAALALADAGVPRAEAERAGDLLMVLLWYALNGHARACGLPDSGTDGPIYASTDMLAWRDAVNWPGLFDAEGRSVVAARMAEDAAAEAVA